MVQIDIGQRLRSGNAKLWMLLIGIDHYEYLSPLNYAAADCQGLAEALEKVTQEFPRKSIKTYAGDAKTEPITAQKIQDSLAEIVAQSQAHDTILFYFAGHGDLEPETEQLYLCLTETKQKQLRNTGLALDQVLQQLKQSKIRHQVVILDACRSGGGQFLSRSPVIVETRSVSSSDRFSYAHPEFNHALDQTLQQYSNQAKNFHALLACGEDEVSLEVPGLKHGVFTHALIQGINGKAADEEGYLDVDRLYKFVRNETQQMLEGRQNPHRVAVGSQDIIIGYSCPTSEKTAVEILQTSESRDFINLTVSERSDCYEKAVSGGILREYPDLSSEELQARERLATLLELRPEKARDLEADNLLYRKAQRYEKEAKQLLYATNQPESDIFEMLHQKFEINSVIAEMFDRINQNILREFHADRDRYATQHRQALRQYGNTQVSSLELRRLQQDLGFSDDRIKQLAQAEAQAFAEHKQQCQEEIRQLWLSNGKIDDLIGAEFQAKWGLGPSIIVDLVEDVRPEVEQILRNIKEEIRRQLYDKGLLDS